VNVEVETPAKTLERLQKLPVAVLADGLDHVGLRRQILNPQLRPIQQHQRICGRAVTMLSRATTSVSEAAYELEFAAVNTLGPGTVLVGIAESDVPYALWGELLATAARARGATGALIHGFVRDARQLSAMDYPTFCLGFCPADSNGRGIVVQYGQPVDCGGVTIASGDYISGDIDGIVAIPTDAVGGVLAYAEDKIGKENLVRDELLAGHLVSDVYDRHKVM
jgi:regulator of RNase E activity RraA